MGPMESCIRDGMDASGAETRGRLAARPEEDTRLRQWQHVARLLCRQRSSRVQPSRLQPLPEPSRRPPHRPAGCRPQRPSHVQCMQVPGGLAHVGSEQDLRSLRAPLAVLAECLRLEVMARLKQIRD
jgi:hypothetical protein